MPADFTLPPDTRSVGSGNPPADMDNVVDAINAISGQYSVLNAAYSGGADPTGVADSTAAIQAALTAAALVPGQRAYGPPGTYKVTAPLTLAPGVMLDGGIFSDAAGFTLKPSSAFTGNAVLYSSDAVGSTGPVIRGVRIDGGSLPGGFAFTAAVSGNLFTATGSAFAAGQQVSLSGGSLPGGFTAATAYYVLAPSGATFTLTTSASPGGTAVTVTGAGSGTVTAAVDGVRIFGNVHAAKLADLSIGNMTGWGWNSVWNSVSGGLPGAYDAQRLVIGGCALGGVALPYASDSTMIDCYVISCGGPSGWYIQSVDNSHFIACRSEWNQGHGFWIDQAWYQGKSSSTTTFVACTTDRNQFDGIHITATGNSPLVFTGCTLRRDGRNSKTGGGNYAGIAVVGAGGGATLPVIIDGAITTPGLDDDSTGTNSPQYGMRVTSQATNVVVNSSYFWGNTAGINDDGTNGSYYGPGITQAHGALASPTVDYSPRAPQVITPTFAQGVASRLSDLTRDYMVYLNVTTAGTATTVAIGPTSTPANTIKASGTATIGDIYSFRLPAGWYVKWAGTTTAIATQTAIGC